MMFDRAAVRLLAIASLAGGAVTGITGVKAGAAGAAPGAPAVAQAQLAPNAVNLVGNFAGDAREEVFSYGPGTAPDSLLTFTRTGAPGGPVDVGVHSLTANGTYRPVEGDFDGDGYDEVFFHGPGSTPDVMWDFVDFDTVTSRVFTIGGSYVPIAGKFTDEGPDDIVWYAPGPAGDSMWDFQPGATWARSPLTINGTYTPIVGRFSQVSINFADRLDDIFWYAPGSAQDFRWQFFGDDIGSDGGPEIQVAGTYRPFSFGLGGSSASDYGRGELFDTIFWHTPGTAPDPVWEMSTVAPIRRTEHVDGTYRPVAGSILTAGGTDILWFHSGGVRMWDYGGGAPYPPGHWDYSFVV